MGKGLEMFLTPCFFLSQVHALQDANSSCRISLRSYAFLQYELMRTRYATCTSTRTHTLLAGSRSLQIKGDTRVTQHEHVFRVSRYSSPLPGFPACDYTHGAREFIWLKKKQKKRKTNKDFNESRPSWLHRPLWECEKSSLGSLRGARDLGGIPVCSCCNVVVPAKRAAIAYCQKPKALTDFCCMQ